MTAVLPDLDPLALDEGPCDDEEGAHWVCCDTGLALCGTELVENDPFLDAVIEDSDCKRCVYLLEFPTACCGSILGAS